ncbi:MAG: hypothetical protein JWR26_1159 [Pedosphaera sp.]|nr:hypothetical protein [Pedosphaera sp.]
MKQPILQKDLAERMRKFLDELPLSADLEWTKSKTFLFEFEAARMLIVLDILAKAGIKPEMEFEMLDFGYLHGLTQEFLHQFFPHSKITVCDRPDSPIFSDQHYLSRISERAYLKLVPCDIADIPDGPAQYQVIMLGEIIEHLDPTRVTSILFKLRKLIKPGGVLIVTTPNGAGLYNCFMTLTGKALVVSPPIPYPVMGYGHIHLWTGNNLRETAEYCGWSFKDIQFYHGREGEMFASGRAEWMSFKTQVFLKGLKFLTDRYPKARGFYVAAFGPS